MKEWTDGIGWNPFRHGAERVESAHGSMPMDGREALKDTDIPKIFVAQDVRLEINPEDVERVLPWMIKYGGTGRPLPLDKLSLKNKNKA